MNGEGDLLQFLLGIMICKEIWHANYVVALPVNNPNVPPMADILSKIVVLSSSCICVMMGVSKKKLRTAILS